jgi:hypothetical protein
MQSPMCGNSACGANPAYIDTMIRPHQIVQRLRELSGVRPYEVPLDLGWEPLDDDNSQLSFCGHEGTLGKLC